MGAQVVEEVDSHNATRLSLAAESAEMSGTVKASPSPPTTQICTTSRPLLEKNLKSLLRVTFCGSLLPAAEGAEMAGTFKARPPTTT